MERSPGGLGRPTGKREVLLREGRKKTKRHPETLFKMRDAL